MNCNTLIANLSATILKIGLSTLKIIFILPHYIITNEEHLSYDKKNTFRN